MSIIELMEMERLGSFQSGSNVFAGDGARAGNQAGNPIYEAAFDQALAIYTAALHGNRMDVWRFQEAMSRSDFQYLFADILQRSVLGSYLEWPSIWSTIAKRGTRVDFRTGRAFTLDGAEGALSKVEELKEYPNRKVVDGKYDYSVDKYGAKIGISWESIINDDLGELRSLPERLAKAARMTEEKFAASLYGGASGPDGTFFSSGHANKMTAALSTGSLQAAMALIWAQKDVDGNPIFTGQLRLVVPPALTITAKNILNATEIWAATGGGDGTAVNQLRAQNWVPQEIAQAVTNPWLPILATSANGDTSWYLFADPGVGRPAMEVGFLRGNEVPALFVKEPNSRRVGSGIIGPEDGDFDTDSIDYKVRHVVGGTMMEYRAAVASDGTTAAL
jgi:hypothetical protein